MAPSLLTFRHQKGSWAAALRGGGGSGGRQESGLCLEGSFIRTEPMQRCVQSPERSNFRRRFRCYRTGNSYLSTARTGGRVILASAGFQVQLSITALPLIQPENPKPNRLHILFHLRRRRWSGHTGNISTDTRPLLPHAHEQAQTGGTERRGGKMIPRRGEFLAAIGRTQRRRPKG